MTCYKNVAVAFLLSAALLLVSTFGPLPIVNNRVQILEFGTSTSFAETTKDNPTIIEKKGQDNPAQATSGAAPNTASAKTLATASAANPQGNVAASTVKATTAKSVEARAKEIANGTPLDYESALILVRYADKYDLNPSLILSVIEVESNFNQWEVGSSRDRGYMQIIPATEKWLASDFGSELGLKYNPDRIFDPEYNIGLAAAYLNLLQTNYGDDYNRILSEYNRGPGNLKKYYQRNGTYSTSYSRKVLSAEKDYLAFNK